MINLDDDQRKFISLAQELLDGQQRVQLGNLILQTRMSVQPPGVRDYELFNQYDLGAIPHYRISLPEVAGQDHLAGDNWSEVNVSAAEAVIHLKQV